MKWLVTGASGFIGRALTARLREDGHEVSAWTRGGAPFEDARVATRRIDIVSRDTVAAALAADAPDVIAHLAAQSFPARSWGEPQDTLRVNVEGTLNVLEAARAAARSVRILVAGSSAQYAIPADAKPLAEEAPQAPMSPYAASKIASDQLAALYGRAYGLDVVRFRPFSLIGPGKDGDATSDFARRIVAIERGAAARLMVGDTSPVRDFLHVADGVSALLLLAEKGETGAVYNICSGQGASIGEVIEGLRALSIAEFKTETDPVLLRPVEDPVKVGDPARLCALGWTPRHALRETLGEILQYWRAKASA